MSADVTQFQPGETVYHRCDSNAKGIVTGHVFLPTGTLIRVVWGPMQINDHYAFELTNEREYAENHE